MHLFRWGKADNSQSREAINEAYLNINNKINKKNDMVWFFLDQGYLQTILCYLH
jgi:hypothetical protein